MTFLFTTLAKNKYKTGIIAGVLISLPTLFFGLFLDDYIQALTIDGKMHLGAPYDTYVFGPNDAAKMDASREVGTHPWFALTDLKLHFFRPLSSALMVFDRTIFGEYIVAYHLHSIFWYLLLLILVAYIYKNSIRCSIAPLAMLLFALDESHVLPVAWWANRNSLLASVFAFAFLAAHITWRERQWNAGMWLSWGALILSFLSGEVALGITAYVFAYECFGHQSPLRSRIIALLMPAIISIGYLAFYLNSQYGVYGSGVYLDPIHQPLEFFAVAPGRLLVLMGTQFLMIPSETVIAFPKFFGLIALLGFTSVSLVAFFLKKAWPELDEEEKRALRWMIPGMVLSTLPVLATFPSMRLLMLPSLGGAVVLAVLLQHAYNKSLSNVPKHWKKLAWVLVVLHLLVAPLIWLITIGTAVNINQSTQAEYRNIQVEDTKDKHMILLQSSNPVLCFYTMVFQQYFGDYEATSWHCLDWAAFDFKVTRVADNAFELELINGQMLSTDYESLFRSPSFGFTNGEEVKLKAFTATVLESGDFGPRKIRFAFPEPLDNAPSYHFLYKKDGAFRPFTFPALNESVTLQKDAWI